MYCVLASVDRASAAQTLAAARSEITRIVFYPTRDFQRHVTKMPENGDGVFFNALSVVTDTDLG